jgi:hypothetical protein
MDIKQFIKKTESPSHQPSGFEKFKDLEATELYCPKCKRAVAVRKFLLLVLPEGDKYEYRCAFCGQTVGSKIDRDIKKNSLII